MLKTKLQANKSEREYVSLFCLLSRCFFRIRHLHTLYLPMHRRIAKREAELKVEQIRMKQLISIVAPALAGLTYVKVRFLSAR